MKYASCFCALVFLLISYASARCPRFNVEKYYRHINTAEISLCRNDRTGAIAEYDKAYTIMGNKMFSKDMYNYFVVCTYEDRGTVQKILLTELKRRGWDSAEYAATLGRFLPAAKLKNVLALYSSLTSVQRSVDVAYIQKLDSVYNLDQRTNKYLRSINNGLLDGPIGDSFKNLTRNNLQYLRQLFSAKFPSDDVVGRDEGPNTFLRYNIILTHNAQGYNDHILDPLFLDAIAKGNFSPSEFADYMIGYNMVDIKEPAIMIGKKVINLALVPYDFLFINDSLFLYPDRDSVINICDENRKRIPGLCNSRDFKEKIIYQHYHREYNFITNNYIVPLQGLPARIKKMLVYAKDPVRL